MNQYRIYDRYTLDFVDGGIIRDYSVDMDYISNNASTINLVEETYAKKGVIVASLSGMSKIFIGTITAVDNTKKTITFKHMKELLNDNILNIFKYTDTLTYKFDAVAALHDIITAAFINIDDPNRKLPLVLEKRGSAPEACYTDDNDTMNVLDFAQDIFDSHNVYLDFDIDFTLNKIRCSIVKNTTTGIVIKDNIKLSEPAFDNNELPTYNKAIVYIEESGNILGTYYLLSTNEVTTDSTAPLRLLPVQTKYISYDEDKGYSALEAATSELQGNIYSHCIQIKFSKEQNLVKPLSFNYGDKVKIIYHEREYDSILTGLKYTKSGPYYTCYFGSSQHLLCSPAV